MQRLTVQITIKSYTFHISTPYAAGTVITKGEAQALCALRAENIQNNLRKLVNDAIAQLGEGELLSAEKLAELQTAFTSYDQRYSFEERKGGRPRLGDIEEEARAVALERIEASFRRDGAPTPPDDLLELMITEQAELPTVKEEARQRVAAKRRVLSEGLDSL